MISPYDGLALDPSEPTRLHNLLTLNQVPVFTSDNFFTFQRPGSDVFRINGNSIQSGWQTIPSSSTGTAMDVSFYSAFDLSSWNPCKVSYNFVETTGVSSDRTDGPCNDAGYQCAQCVMTFNC